MKQPIYIDNSTASNKIINSTGNKITITLSSPIILDQNKKYEICLLNSSIVYCHPNVVNKYLKFTYNSIDYSLPIKNGLYTLDDLNIAFTNLTSSLYEDGLFTIEGLDATSQVAIFCNDYINTEIDFSGNDNILTLLGFSNSTSKFQPTSAQNYYLSQNKAQLNNISNFFISVDGCNSFLSNGNSSSTVYIAPINVKPNRTQTISPLIQFFVIFIKILYLIQ